MGYIFFSSLFFFASICLSVYCFIDFTFFFLVIPMPCFSYGNRDNRCSRCWKEEFIWRTELNLFFWILGWIFLSSTPSKLGKRWWQRTEYRTKSNEFSHPFHLCHSGLTLFTNIFSVSHFILRMSHCERPRLRFNFYFCGWLHRKDDIFFFICWFEWRVRTRKIKMKKLNKRKTSDIHSFIRLPFFSGPFFSFTSILRFSNLFGSQIDFN